MPPPWFQGMNQRFMMALCVFAVVCGLLIVCLSCLVPLCFACLYKQKVTDTRQTLPDFRGYATQQVPLAQSFRFPVFGCFEDCNVCLHSWFCSSVRTGDTHQAAGTEKFWNIILWWIFAGVVGAVIGGSSGGARGVAGLIMAAVMTGKRQALKQRLGIAPGSSCEDFMLWWCCTPCVIAQEAREVDHAAS